MLRINQWIIQDSSDLLSDIHSRYLAERQAVLKPGILAPTGIERRPLLCFLFAAKTRLVLPPIWSYLIPHPMLMGTTMRLILFHPRMALCWEITVFIVALWYTANLRLTSTYCRKTIRFYVSYVRITHSLLYAYHLCPPSLHQYHTYERKASGKAGRIGFFVGCKTRPM